MGGEIGWLVGWGGDGVWGYVCNLLMAVVGLIISSRSRKERESCFGDVFDVVCSG